MELSHLLAGLLRGGPGGRPGLLESLPAHDWEALVSLAVRQGLAPLLYERLKDTPEAPEAALEALRQAYRANGLKNLRLYGELHLTLAALQDAQVRAIVLKGAHLAQEIYASPALRTMNDADILVRKPDLPKAEACMAGSGYQLVTKDDDRDWYGRHHFHFHYFHPQKDTRIEVHWHLLPPDSPLRVDLEGLWERARQATIAGVKAWVLSPEDLLLHLCLHTAVQFPYEYYPLRALYDISQAAAHYREELDWALLMRRAQEWGLANATCLTLALCRKLLGAPVPELALEDGQPAGFEARMLAWAEARALAAGGEGAAGPLGGRMSENFERVWVAGKPKDRLAAALKTFFPSPERLAERYGLPPGSRRQFVYYPRLWIELAQQHGRRSWLLFRGDRQARQWAEREKERNALVSWLLEQ